MPSFAKKWILWDPRPAPISSNIFLKKGRFGEVRQLASRKGGTSYFHKTSQEYKVETLGNLALKGDQLIMSLRGRYPALWALRELGFRKMQPRLMFAHIYHLWIPDKYQWIVNTLTVGVGAQYTGGCPVAPRIRGLPYHHTDEHHCTLIGEKLWRMYSPAECSSVPRNPRAARIR